MKPKLIQFLFWLLTKLGAEYYREKPEPVRGYPLPKSVTDLIPEAHFYVARLDQARESGEWKKHQAYAAMIKNHPESAKRDISLAIEIAVREL